MYLKAAVWTNKYGTPKHVGLVISSACPFSLDVVASSMIGLKPKQVPTIVKSVERGPGF